jgi:hypothetical protein
MSIITKLQGLTIINKCIKGKKIIIGKDNYLGEQSSERTYARGKKRSEGHFTQNLPQVIPVEWSDTSGIQTFILGIILMKF